MERRLLVSPNQRGPLCRHRLLQASPPSSNLDSGASPELAPGGARPRNGQGGPQGGRRCQVLGKEKAFLRDKGKPVCRVNTNFPDGGHCSCSEFPTGVPKSPVKGVKPRGQPSAVLMMEQRHP